MPEVVREVLAMPQTSSRGQSTSSCPHQANLRINQFVGQKLGIPEAKTVHNIEKYGNTTAATIPLGLSEAWREGPAAAKGRTCSSRRSAAATRGAGPS